MQACCLLLLALCALLAVVDASRRELKATTAPTKTAATPTAAPAKSAPTATPSAAPSGGKWNPLVLPAGDKCEQPVNGVPATVRVKHWQLLSIINYIYSIGLNNCFACTLLPDASSSRVRTALHAEPALPSCHSTFIASAHVQVINKLQVASCKPIRRAIHKVVYHLYVADAMNVECQMQNSAPVLQYT